MTPNRILFLLAVYLLGATLGVIFDMTGTFGTDSAAALASGVRAPEFTNFGIPVIGDIGGAVLLTWDYFAFFFGCLQFNWPFLDGIFGFVRTMLMFVVGAIFIWVAVTLITAWRRAF